jgi:flagellar biosynthesis protein FlhF
MNVKTITAPSIHAALAEARRVLGENVVLMESTPAHGNEPARITVMADASKHAGVQASLESKEESTGRRTGTRAAAAPESVERNSDARHELVGESRTRTSASARQRAGNAGRGTDGRSGRGRTESATDVAVMPERKADGNRAVHGDHGYSAERGSRHSVGARTMSDAAPETSGDASSSHIEPNRRGYPGEAGRGLLFPNRKDMVDGRDVSTSPESTEAIERLLVAQLQLLHDRLDRMERRFDDAIIGAGQAWTANPIFSTLLGHGMRPATITRIFDRLAKKGYAPDTDAEKLKWAVAQEIRRSLDLSAPKQNAGAQVFLGPSGAGKTSLLLKLALHPGFFGRSKTAVIIIENEKKNTDFRHSPLDLYRSHGLPVQVVRTVDDMCEAVTRVQHFDHILIDTPPMPLDEASARKMLKHVKQLVDPIMPLRVQFVLNATRSLEDFDTAFVQELPLRPDMVAFTHLDETGGWGRIAEWLLAVRLPVQFVSTGPGVPDSAMSFSPTWFVEEMMQL